MSSQFTSPVCRIVQGGFKLQPKKDIKGNLVKDNEGKQVEECYMAIAIPKNHPELGAFYGVFDAQARASFPHLFPNGGACTHPRFAMKWQDGDGADSTGKSVADKPGFAGHWVIKMATRFAPRVYARDSHGNLVQLEDPEKIIKLGYKVCVSGTVDGNGVEPNNAQAVPGLFVSPNMVLFVAPDEEIVSGPDPNAVFANVASQPGAVAAGVAVGGPANLAGPPLPGAAPMPGNAAPLPGAVASQAALPAPGVVAGNAPMPGAVAAASPPLPGATGTPPLPPGAAVQPTYAMTASAQGASLQDLLKIGWTIENLVAQGHAVRVS